MSETPAAPCELCAQPGGEILWEGMHCRVVRVGGGEGAAFPGFCRVIWREHVREVSDLDAAARRHLLDMVAATERAVRNAVQPDKINLAAFGNKVPHLHWHVIPRWRDDSHFPEAIWAAPQRAAPARIGPALETLRRCLREALDEMRLP